MTRVVALGGGHGLAASLRAIRRYASEVSAIVSVADDGGSSGKLRSAYGIPPPGDMRKCLVALASSDSVWVDAFEHRFGFGELEGHALGNLIIAGLASTTGDFDLALTEAGRLLGAVGTVIPATTEPVVLKASVRTSVRATDGEGRAVEGPTVEGPAVEGPAVEGRAVKGPAVEGQVAVANTAQIEGVSLVPADPRAARAAIEALAAAEQVVIGPGSLYTSVLAAVIVPGIRDALASTPGRKVYVCNLRTQHRETEGYDVAAHVAALSEHGIDVDVVLCQPGALSLGGVSERVVERPVAQPGAAVHDPALLAVALSDLVG